ncbi:MAG: hypothetical protein ABI642_15305 [Polaromonas sp.]
MSFVLSESSVYEPFNRILLVRQNALDEAIEVCCHGIANTCDLPYPVDALALVRKTPPEAASKQIEYAKTLACTAQREMETGFGSIFEMATVLLWGALETAVRDFVTLWLAKHPQARESDVLGRIKLRFADFTSLSTEELHESVVGQIERETAAHLKKGMDRFDALLSAARISVPVEAALRQPLLALSEVSNVLVHKAGTVDRRLAQSCPWLELKERGTMRVSRDRYMKYNRSVGNYAACIPKTAPMGVESRKQQASNGRPEGQAVLPISRKGDTP